MDPITQDDLVALMNFGAFIVLVVLFCMGWIAGSFR